MKLIGAFLCGFLLGIAFMIAVMCVFATIAARLDYRNRDDLTKEEWRLK